MFTALKAGLFYFLVIFIAGSILGIGRNVLLVPWIGEIASVLWEIPVMLFIAWFVSSYVIEKLEVEPTIIARLIMGGVALALLIVGELSLSIYMTYLTSDMSTALYRDTKSILGLLAQITAAFFPLLQSYKRKTFD
ncbi:hypothetical protein F9L33_07215 [Amylibacter sp. SFDW26]|uniref:hypothetical protein n=1 Tax=Amylibacter sp. SFDW26 TaxID=2652722 RepID=UPI00126221AC|nr:hypothetical protein [Amylibacter sp. SFDW26]KAB7614427.1 hypothetical protein F9L33_07215 [Amylibacter sp. SFDW26]